MQTPKDKEGTVTKALAYARVSSKEQDKEGFSIPAQQKLLQGYATTNQIAIVEEFIDVETAKASGRTNFEAMLRYLKAHPSVNTILVEKTDRLYRNLADWVRLDELSVQIHFVKEGTVISQESRSSEKFMHGIKVLMAKNYIDNLSEETRKGMQEKAEQGIWPTVAPIGYLNVERADGKKAIDVDPKLGPVVACLFGWYATGTLSLSDVAQKAHGAGLVSRKRGNTVARSQVHSMLRNPIYTGDFVWKGQYFRGTHKALISHDLFDKVQAVLDGKNASKEKKTKRDFAFAGLLRCGHCNCAMVGEIKKKRYVYYHCTGAKGKCPEKYVREEVLAGHFCSMLSSLRFGDEMLGYVRKALEESHIDETQEHEASIARLRGQYDLFQRRLHTVYMHRVDGTVDQQMFDAVSAEWRKEQSRLLEEIAFHQSADQSYLEEGVRLLDLASSVGASFSAQSPSEKRRMLNFVLSNSSWKNGALTPKWKQPFDLIAETAVAAASEQEKNGAESARCKVWLRG